MAYTTPTTKNIGDATKKEIFDVYDNNDIDFDTRLNSVEATVKKIDVFKFELLNASSFSSATGVAYFQAEDDFTITKGSFRIFEKGSLTGFAEIDVKKSITDLNGTSFSSIFTTKPKITYATSADYDETTNQVLDPTASVITAGDFLRLDITTTPGNGVFPKVLITVYGE